MTDITAINALAELERLGVKFEPASENEVRLCCPLHDDDTPSLSLNTDKNLWICHASSCKKKGDVVTLLAHLLQCERRTMLTDLGTRYEISSIRAINPDTVEGFHAKIWKAGPLLKALRERGVTDDMLRRYRIGFHAGRITIPITDAGERYVNIRRYLPGAPGSQKMKNTPAYGQPRLFPLKQLDHDVVWLCGGELKAIVASWYLNEQDVGAICVTAGEGAWKDEWGPLFREKRIVICMDIDEAGRKASLELASRLHTFADIRIAELPLDSQVHPKGDINDFIAEGARCAELMLVAEAAKTFVPDIQRDVEEPAIAVPVTGATRRTNIGKRVSFEAVVSMAEQNPFLIPKEVGVACERDQPNCHRCPIMLLDKPEHGAVTATIRATTQGVLDLIDTPSSRHRDGIKSALKIPSCKSVQFAVHSYFSARDVRLSPQLSITEEAGSDVLLPGYCVDNEVDLNVPHRFEGVLWPHPKDQRAILLLDEADQAIDSLSTFEPTDEELESLEMFKPSEWTSEAVEAKLSEIYADFEANVTGIRRRPEMHRVIDLTYHSVLFLKFDGRIVPGWINALILGDSSQGKTEASVRIKEHYGLGTRVECKNASTAGLIGGLQQIGNRWFVSWGVIPMHDRRLVMLEEVKGASIETIGKLTDMRSSGVAEIPKIEHRKANARTRLIFISNPRSSRQLVSYSFGVNAVEELIGGLEDVRRFDIATLVSATQVSAADINVMREDHEQVEHTYSSEFCRRLVLWAWTRKPDQVTFEKDAVEAILAASKKACSKYSEAMPLVDRGTMRLKLARLSAALAARTYSAVGRQLVVRKCHVDTTWKFLDELYSAPIFGYADFSKSRKRTEEMTDREEVKLFILARRYPADVVRNILCQDDITIVDIQDWCDLDRDAAQTVMSYFVRKRALYRRRTAYRKTAEFIALLKEMEAEGVPQEDAIDDINNSEF